jgi:hypothetical protein
MRDEVPCAKRLEHGGWCLLVDGHDGVCDGLPREYGPAPPPPEQKYFAAYRTEVARKWDPKTAAEWIAEVENRRSK